jgi:hypothetical protein
MYSLGGFSMAGMCIRLQYYQRAVLEHFILKTGRNIRENVFYGLRIWQNFGLASVRYVGQFRKGPFFDFLGGKLCLARAEN